MASPRAPIQRVEILEETSFAVKITVDEIQIDALCVLYKNIIELLMRMGRFTDQM